MPKRGVGQMSDVPVAAFDPVFWLHHWYDNKPKSFFSFLTLSVWLTVVLAISTASCQCGRR